MREGVNLLWREIGDGYVVFNEASGQTHVPHPLSEWILREIENSPVTLDSLAERLASESAIEHELAISSTRQVLAEFADLGLVRLG